MAELADVGMHEQRLAAAGGVLQAELVQLFELVGQDAGLPTKAVPELVEALHLLIQAVQQTVAVAAVLVQIDLDEQQRQPLEVLPLHRLALAQPVERVGVGDDVGVEALELFFAIAPGRLPLAEQGMQIVMMPGSIQARRRVPQALGQHLDRPYPLAVVTELLQRVDAEPAQQPLVEHQLFTEVLLRREFLHPRLPRTPRHQCRSSSSAPSHMRAMKVSSRLSTRALASPVSASPCEPLM